MTKSTKKKKEKTADFTKRRLKLGKGKQAASNAVDTSFKARSIALPQQGITIEKDSSTPTTKRKLTFDDLLGHLKHYSAGVRKDAFQGLHELLSEHSELIEGNLVRLINICARLIIDEDALVRKALHTFLSWLLPRIPRDSLVPHAPTLLLFTASAQSHIFPEIRIDAIRVLDLLLEFVPEQVVNGLISPGLESQNGHGRKILDGYLGLLNVGARFSEDESKIAGPSSGISVTLVTLSTASKAMVLKSFSKFLLSAVAQEETGTISDHPDAAIPLWYLTPAFSDTESFSSFTEILSLQGLNRSSRYVNESTTESNVDGFVGRFALATDSAEQKGTSKITDLELVLREIEGLSGKNGSLDDILSSDIRLISSICRSIHPVLVSTFLDNAPSAFSPTQIPAATELELILSLMEVSRSLYGLILRDGSAMQDQKRVALEELKVIINHMSVYFPFGENRLVSQDMQIDIAFQKMNLIFCELFSLQSFDYSNEDIDTVEDKPPLLKKRKLDSSQTKKSQGATSTAADKQEERVREYVVQCLRGSSGSNHALSPLNQSLTAQAFFALLPTLWWLLNSPDRKGRGYNDVLVAILRHAIKTGSSSGVKKVATEFAARLALLQCERSYRGIFRVTLSSPEEEQQIFREWVLHLPKALWELGDKNPTTSELILLFLLRAAQRRLWMIDTEALSTRLAPFFTMQHATRGELRGPYSRLPEPSPESFPSDPRNGDLRRKTKTRPLKYLALDVAATLVSNIGQGSSYTPQKTKIGGIEKTTRGSGVPYKENIPKIGSARAALESLRLAVEKAVNGTPEEAYWTTVSVM